MIAEKSIDFIRRVRWGYAKTSIERALCDEIIEFIQQQERENPKPLTLDELQKAFALACRILADDYGSCPAENGPTGWPECDGETGNCGDDGIWACWQKYILERVQTEPVCRVCGCTQDNACPGGCWWVEEDLCSSCAEDEEDIDYDTELPPGVELPIDPVNGEIIYDETGEELFEGGDCPEDCAECPYPGEDDNG